MKMFYTESVRTQSLLFSSKQNETYLSPVVLQLLLQGLNAHTYMFMIQLI